jgi:hypothetical protein
VNWDSKAYEGTDAHLPKEMDMTETQIPFGNGTEGQRRYAEELSKRDNFESFMKTLDGGKSIVYFFSDAQVIAPQDWSGEASILWFDKAEGIHLTLLSKDGEFIFDSDGTRIIGDEEVVRKIIADLTIHGPGDKTLEIPSQPAPVVGFAPEMVNGRRCRIYKDTKGRWCVNFSLDTYERHVSRQARFETEEEAREWAFNRLQVREYWFQFSTELQQV